MGFDKGEPPKHPELREIWFQLSAVKELSSLLKDRKKRIPPEEAHQLGEILERKTKDIYERISKMGDLSDHMCEKMDSDFDYNPNRYDHYIGSDGERAMEDTSDGLRPAVGERRAQRKIEKGERERRMEAASLKTFERTVTERTIIKYKFSRAQLIVAAIANLQDHKGGHFGSAPAHVEGIDEEVVFTFHFDREKEE